MGSRTLFLATLAIFLLSLPNFGCTCQGDCSNSSRTGNNDSGNGGGTTGPTGPQGPAGPAGGVVWKDSTGAVATGVMTGALDATLFYVDDSNQIWSIDPETATLDAAKRDVTVEWSNADCTGVPYTAPVIPNFTFRVSGETAIRVRPDTLSSYATSVQSTSNADGSCTPMEQATTQTLIQLPNASMLDVPTVPFVAPLHPERP